VLFFPLNLLKDFVPSFSTSTQASLTFDIIISGVGLVDAVDAQKVSLSCASFLAASLT
jgi:hypothetical protein